MSVELGDPFSKVEAPAFLTDVLRKNGPEFTAALGIALRRIQRITTVIVCFSIHTPI